VVIALVAGAATVRAAAVASRLSASPHPGKYLPIRKVRIMLSHMESMCREEKP
jgi:hypothetical protein